MSLKDKPLKKCHTDKRKMIDDLHSEIVQQIDEEDKLNEYYLDNGLLLDQYYSSDKKFIFGSRKVTSTMVSISSRILISPV